MEWKDGLQSEIDFWVRWYGNKGLIWPENYIYRLDPDSEIQGYVAKYLKSGYEKILDVGAGPLTSLGKKCNKRSLNIIACDPLADYYEDINKQFNIIPIVKTEFCKAELLSQKYGCNTFDIIHAENCIDHSENPLKCIIEMLHVVKCGGVILLRHTVKEGENQHYIGLHQWNFYKENTDFMISGKGMMINVNEKLSIFGARVQTVIEGDIIFNTINV
jgi:SAM-dependent methyltransferase